MGDKRAELEQVAIDAIKHSGISSVSFRTLAETVDVKSSSVHYHFPTKGDLVESVVRRYSEDFSSELLRIQREHRTLRRRLVALIEIFEEVSADSEMCLCGSLAADVHTLNDASKRLLRDFFATTESWLITVIEDAGSDAIKGLKTHQFAALLMASLEGAGLLHRAIGDAKHLNAVRQLVKAMT
ncbi:MAG: TetR/AcrR family transcriptional regulator [Pseudomonadota bacterium]